MDVSGTFKNGMQEGRFVLSAFLAAAITALLVGAVPASAEPTEGGTVVSIATAEAPAPVTPDKLAPG